MAQSRGEFERVKAYVDQVFVDIDRPEEHLVSITIEIEGDSSGETGTTFNPALSLAEQRALLRHAGEMLLEEADGPQWRDGGFHDQFRKRVEEG